MVEGLVLYLEFIVLLENRLLFYCVMRILHNAGEGLSFFAKIAIYI